MALFIGASEPPSFDQHGVGMLGVPAEPERAMRRDSRETHAKDLRVFNSALRLRDYVFPELYAAAYG
jgi:hypothetical protein